MVINIGVLRNGADDVAVMALIERNECADSTVQALTWIPCVALTEPLRLLAWLLLGTLRRERRRRMRDGRSLIDEMPAAVTRRP